jgi:hypothetical protein
MSLKPAYAARTRSTRYTHDMMLAPGSRVRGALLARMRRNQPGYFNLLPILNNAHPRCWFV